MHHENKLNLFYVTPFFDSSNSAFGPNAWLVDDMYEQYINDPESVSLSWREFFKDYKPVSVSQSEPNKEYVELEKQTGSVVTQKVEPKVKLDPAFIEKIVALRGVGSRIVENMESSLHVPTATSIREVAAKLLSANRTLLNEILLQKSGLKVSFTHLIAYASLKALKTMPEMTTTFVENFDGKGTNGYVIPETVGLGLAVDTKKQDGSRSLLVPTIKSATSLSFLEFVAAYEEILRKIASNKLSVDDFKDTTFTITNPGTLGTNHSVPRLMSGQSFILGVGAIVVPQEFKGLNSKDLSRLAISPVLTLTSTYDHRVIQGAQSGEYLSLIDGYLNGKDNFYDDLFNETDANLKPFVGFVDVLGQDEITRQVRMEKVVENYRLSGHLVANLDPLNQANPKVVEELNLEAMGLSIWDLDRDYHSGKTSFGKELSKLRRTYMSTLTVEMRHIENSVKRQWLVDRFENHDNELTQSEKLYVLDRLNAAEVFEKFLHTRYVGQKRFGLEGAESVIPMIDGAIRSLSNLGLEEVVLGMSHRGRLNVLANIVGKSFEDIFKEFEGEIDPESVQGSGDVKYHKGAQGSFKIDDSKSIKVELVSNPSHLEAVGPVVQGVVRAKQDLFSSDHFKAREAICAIVLHGDAAFIGQGVVAETLNLSQLAGYRTGGTIHIVINNQVGFTTNPLDSRSSTYSTDIAKMIDAPIIHVNGDDPSACLVAARISAEYKVRFKSDVVIDMVCYRLHGHNEGDDPSYTQPLMYRIIDSKRSVRKIYTELLTKRGDISIEIAEMSLDNFQNQLQDALDETRLTISAPPVSIPLPQPVKVPLRIETGIDFSTLSQIEDILHMFPKDFELHPKLRKQLEASKELFQNGFVDWSLGEALAFGSIIKDGIGLRLSGQDSRRGTFSHRHASFVDYNNGNEYYPLKAFEEQLRSSNLDPGSFQIYDSSLSEYAVLGFEFGYSCEAKDSVVIWEAQFGDFANGAQIIIDNFLAASEDKWDQTSGLVMFLPHGYEGQGPEHSSARLERFLTLAAGGNIEIAQPTTSRQLFHLLRNQSATRSHPLIVATPKSLLRAKFTRSKVEEFLYGSFEPVITEAGHVSEARSYYLNDESLEEEFKETTRLILTSGKIAYDAIAYRDTVEAGRTNGDSKSRIIRIERLYPWPKDEIARIIDACSELKEIVWLQDEPDNMGAYHFAKSRLLDQIDTKINFKVSARIGAGSPATGSAKINALELESILAKAFL